MGKMSVKEWADKVVKEDEIDRYLDNGKDFIDHDAIMQHLEKNRKTDKIKVRDIIQKSLSIERLEPDETAALLHVDDPELWQEMAAAGLEIKKKVYDNRIVIFAPLYCSNLCVNNCLYCGFRKDNKHEVRR
ncbi:MAG TPA: [FeFe] hydrogenase H-cluster radical SAM maturase HydG, partial [Firmicutes bacterium]|nr:[FeFe] hydrogenase H-cluster radical SAM maturase HydG [Bacillota bacterium]